MEWSYFYFQNIHAQKQSHGRSPGLIPTVSLLQHLSAPGFSRAAGGGQAWSQKGSALSVTSEKVKSLSWWTTGPRECPGGGGRGNSEWWSAAPPGGPNRQSPSVRRANLLTVRCPPWPISFPHSSGSAPWYHFPTQGDQLHPGQHPSSRRTRAVGHLTSQTKRLYSNPSLRVGSGVPLAPDNPYAQKSLE